MFIQMVLTSLIEMGRKSTAKLILDELGDEGESNSSYVVSYSFTEKANSRFWRNLNEIISLVGGRKVHRSVYYGSRRGARAVMELAKRYGADVRWFATLEYT